jgi:hypothetical protein
VLLVEYAIHYSFVGFVSLLTRELLTPLSHSRPRLLFCFHFGSLRVCWTKRETRCGSLYGYHFFGGSDLIFVSNRLFSTIVQWLSSSLSSGVVGLLNTSCGVNPDMIILSVVVSITTGVNHAKLKGNALLHLPRITTLGLSVSRRSRRRSEPASGRSRQTS